MMINIRFKRSTHTTTGFFFIYIQQLRILYILCITALDGGGEVGK